jgi:hypothetical protein
MAVSQCAETVHPAAKRNSFGPDHPWAVAFSPFSEDPIWTVEGAWRWSRFGLARQFLGMSTGGHFVETRRRTAGGVGRDPPPRPAVRRHVKLRALTAGRRCHRRRRRLN